MLSNLGISGYYRRIANQKGGKITLREEGSLLLTLRSIFGLGMWLLILLYLVNSRWMVWSQYPAPGRLWGPALGIMVLDPSFPVLALPEPGRQRHQDGQHPAEHQLVTRGPYRWIHHPLYTFGFLFFFSFNWMAASWFMLVVILITLTIILARTPIAEAKLIEEFGKEYRAFMQPTGRYLAQLKANHPKKFLCS